MIPDPPCLVTFFIESRAAEPEELRDPAALTEVATALRAFHDSGEQLTTDFDSFQVVRDYAETAEQHGVTLPEGYRSALACAKAIAKAIRGAEHEPVPCHNDLLAANFLHDGDRLRIVDWEYAGMGDRYFDLGNFAVNNELDEDDEARLLEAYFGEPPDARRRATLRLMRFMSDFREAMWGVVQSGISELDFDFPGYARKHFDRLAAAAEEPRFGSSGSRRPVAAARELPGSARCVIIGGGVGGTSIAYHLARLGCDDVVLLERNQLTSGSTFHSAGLVGQLRGSVSLTKMMMYSVELYRELGAESGVRPRLDRVRRHPARLERGAHGGAAPPGGLGEDVRPADGADLGRRRRRELFPLMSTDGVVGAAWLPTDGYLDPSQLTYALADGARRAGAQILTSTRVTGIDVRDGRVRGVRTERGDVEAEVVVNAAGMFAAEVGRLAGVRVPVVPMSHEYIVTQPFRERDPANPLPTLRDPDLLIYFREEGGGLVMGGYERPAAPAFLARRERLRAHPARLQRPPARRRLGPLRGDRGQLAPAGSADGGRAGHAHDQRPGGLHARQRVLPRRDGGARPVRGGRLLRPRPGGRRRHRAGDGRVDRRGRAEPRPLAHGRAPLRRPVPLAVLHAQARPRDLRDLLRHQVPELRAPGRAAAAHLAGERLAPRARRGLRREVGLGAGQLVRVERGPRRRVAAPARLGRPELVAGDRRRARRLPRARRDLRRELVREARDHRAGRRGAARAPVRQPRGARGREDHLHADAEPARRDRVRLHRRAARRGALLDRHRHRVRQPRPRVDPQAPARRRQRAGARRDLGVRVLRDLGPARARGAAAAHAAGPLERRVPLHDPARDHRRRRAGARRCA